MVKLINSALPYVNNSPHLGNIIGCVLSADVYSRFCKKNGEKVYYICGADEFGTATEMKAIEENTTPEKICQTMMKKHKKIYSWFGIEFDYFGHTNSKIHKKTVQKIFKILYKNGYFKSKNLDQFYCQNCNIFLADRYVSGECFKCKKLDVKGDQCDFCGILLKSTELVNPKCIVCKSVPVIRNSDHLFFRLSCFKDYLVDRNYLGFSSNAVEISRMWLKGELNDRCMTRNLKFKWGVKVPLKDFEDKVFYVWFDAPIAYLSFYLEMKDCENKRNISDSKKNHGEINSKLNDLKVNDLTENIHDQDTENISDDQDIKILKEDFKNMEWIIFMGKDNVVFHSIIFSSILKGSEIPSNLKINSTEYLMFENKKFSKSRKIGIFGEDLIENKLGISSFWRFYLMKIRPETKDSNFSFFDFKNSITELINGYGNLCNRVLKFFKKKNLKIKYLKEDSDNEIINKINKIYKEYLNEMKSINLRNGLKLCIESCILTNSYLQETFKNREKQVNSFSLAFSIIILITKMFEPFIPEISEKVFKMIGIENGNFDEELKIINEFELKNEIEVVFKNFSDEEFDEIKKRFGGSE